jgi:VWFA-related protein
MKTDMKRWMSSGRIAVAVLGAMLLMRASNLRAQSSLLQPGAAVTDAPALEEMSGDANEDARYGDGTRAIQENRWSDAESIFAGIAARHGARAEAALYWKAFAESKQGKSDAALKACAELRQGYPKSRWIDDCGALEIEIHGNSGQPVEPQSQRDENLKLLALNTLMHRDESKALPEIQQILAGSQTVGFKEHALFVLAQSGSKQAQKMLAEVANGADSMPAEVRSNQALRQWAQQLIAAGRSGQSIAAQIKTTRQIGLDLVVTGADGKSVAGLKPEDFTVLDNGQPVKLTGFHAANEAVAMANARPDLGTEVVILIDTVNASLADIGVERDQIGLFLKQNGGRLSNPVSIYIFNGKGAVGVAPASRDGNALATALSAAAPNLHPILRSQGFYGAEEKIELSLNALLSLAVEKGSVPGRKMLLWISPGWPLLERMDAVSIDRLSKTMFNFVVTMSGALRNSRITLSCIDPVRSPGEETLEWFRYESYLKPVTQMRKAEAGHISLQVLARQSGGEALSFGHDYLSGEIATMVANADNYYYLSFDSPPAAHADEYHSLKVTVDKSGLTVHTRNGYYDQP